jgi:hypothetical protein
MYSTSVLFSVILELLPDLNPVVIEPILNPPWTDTTPRREMILFISSYAMHHAVCTVLSQDGNLFLQKRMLGDCQDLSGDPAPLWILYLKKARRILFDI